MKLEEDNGRSGILKSSLNISSNLILAASFVLLGAVNVLLAVLEHAIITLSFYKKINTFFKKDKGTQ